MNLKRLLYFGYYLKELDKRKFKIFLNHVSSTENLSKVTILVDVIKASIKYNISILEYFQFHFYKLSPKERDRKSTRLNSSHVKISYAVFCLKKKKKKK